MLVSLVPISAMTSSAASVSAPSDGMNFKSDTLHAMDKNLTISNSMTVEAEIWIPHNATNNKPTAQNTVFSNYGDTGTNGNAKPYYRVDITTAGYIRFDGRNFGKYNIRVNAVLPGMIKTDRWEKNPDFYANVPSRFTPIGDVAVGKDIADAVYYFAACARSTTGAELTVDGGNTIQLYPLVK